MLDVWFSINEILQYRWLLIHYIQLKAYVHHYNLDFAYDLNHSQNLEATIFINMYLLHKMSSTSVFEIKKALFVDNFGNFQSESA